MSRSLGTLTVDLIARMGGFEQGMSRADRVTKERMRSIRRNIDAVSDRVRNLAVVAAAVVTAGAALTTRMVNDTRQMIDSQDKLARSLNGTYTGMQAVNLAASDAGIEKMDDSMNRLNRRLGAVEMGTGEAAKTVERLNLDLDELAEMDVDEKLAVIADRIQEYGGSAQESARHLQQLGFEQHNAIELFRNGGDAIRAAREEVKRYGLDLSEIDAAKVQLANDALSRIRLTQQGFMQDITVQLSGPLLALSEYFTDLTVDIQKTSGEVESMFDNFVIGGIGAAAEFRKVGVPLKALLDDIWAGYQSLPSWAQEVGVVGALLGGRMGVAAVAGISKLAEDTKVTAQWFAAMTSGKITRWEWASGSDAALERLREQGIDPTDTSGVGQAPGPSIIESLFGDPGGADQDQWENDMVERYRQAKERIERLAAGVSGDRVNPAPILGLPGSGEADEAQRLDELYAASRESMERQVALYGEVSEAARLRYEIEQGSLSDLSEERQESLVVLAEELDQLRTNEEERRAQAEEDRARMQQMSQFGLQAARNIQNQFSEYLFDPFDEGLSGMLAGFADTLRRMAAEVASTKVLKWLFTSMAGASNPIIAGIGEDFAGAFDSGGYIPAGKFGLVGEVGPELISGPASVTSRADTARAMGGVTLHVDATDPGAEGRIRSMIEQDVFPRLVETARARVAQDMRRPRFA